MVSSPSLMLMVCDNREQVRNPIPGPLYMWWEALESIIDIEGSFLVAKAKWPVLKVFCE